MAVAACPEGDRGRTEREGARPAAKKRRRKASALGAEAAAAEAAPPPVPEAPEVPEASARATRLERPAPSAPSSAKSSAPGKGKALLQEEEEDRRGIIHLADVPLCMKADKLRHIMEQFGQVGRIFLAPESREEWERRKRAGGNRKPRFTEGWVEFAERKIAKRVALSLNGTTVGGKKRHNFYREHIWNMRYLPKFKWHQLKEGSVYNRQVRKARLEQRMSQARRENDFYLESVEQAKSRQNRDKRLAAAKEAKNTPAAEDSAKSSEGGASAQRNEERRPGSLAGASSATAVANKGKKRGHRDLREKQDEGEKSGGAANPKGASADADERFPGFKRHQREGPEEAAENPGDALINSKVLRMLF